MKKLSFKLCLVLVSFTSNQIYAAGIGQDQLQDQAHTRRINLCELVECRMRNATLGSLSVALVQVGPQNEVHIQNRTQSSVTFFYRTRQGFDRESIQEITVDPCNIACLFFTNRRSQDPRRDIREIALSPEDLSVDQAAGSGLKYIPGWRAPRPDYV